jgi:hypothetical protein
MGSQHEMASSYMLNRLWMWNMKGRSKARRCSDEDEGLT